MARDSTSRISHFLPFGNSTPKSVDNGSGPAVGLRPSSLRGGPPSPPQKSRSREPSPAPRRTLRSSHSSQDLRPARQSMDQSRRPPRVSSILPGQVQRPVTREGGLAGIGNLGDDVLLPPPPIGGAFVDASSSPGGSRASSRTRGRPESSAGSMPNSRAGSPAGGWLRPSTPSEGNKLKRKSWIPGKSHNRTESATLSINSGSDSRNASLSLPLPVGPAFVVGPMGRQPYEITPLVTAQQIPELWFDDGDLFVHLFDQASGHGPSFRLQSSVVADSRSLTGQLPSQHYQHSHERQSRRADRELRPGRRPNVSVGRPGSRQASRQRVPSEALSRSTSSESLDAGLPPPTPLVNSTQDGTHVYLNLHVQRDANGEVASDGLETLVRIRNLFAFLIGQVLIGTHLQPSLFSIFNSVASTLRRYDFTNQDGSSLGESATASFLGYVEDLRLADVRQSREKTLEAIVLGERMKCLPLYREGYVHAVGKWKDVMGLRSLVIDSVSEKTRSRLEKSYMVLEGRVKPIKQRIESFEFPSLFAGVLASASTKKVVDTQAWKAGFVAMRKHVIFHYKARYGSWPPKAKSSKNDFEESGLNRLLAREVYQDFCDLYDMLVDRSSLTTRSADIGVEDDSLSGDPSIQVLRSFMSEYDRSTPPVLPPIPYDVPNMPDPKHVKRGFEELTLRKQVKERSKKIKDDEINLALMQSYNRDMIKATSFLESFMAFERRASSGQTFDDLINMRIGQWIFLYVVMQSLPLLAIDAPDIHWTEGVEYWLCEAPRGSPPWVKDGGAQQQAYYQVAGGNRVVALPSDVIDNSVEGIFFRSHCWQVASQWTQQHPQQQPLPLSAQASISSKASTAPFDSNFVPTQLDPPTVIGAAGYGRSPSHGSPLHSPAIGIGLEALPLPPSLAAKETRRLSAPDPSKNFDAILGAVATPPPPAPQKKKYGKLTG